MRELALILSLLFCVVILPLPFNLMIDIVHASDKHIDKEVFNGKEIVVLAYNYPPMFTYKKMKDGTYQFGGFAKELLEDARGYFNFDIRYTVLDPIKVAKYGIWEAILEPLDKKVWLCILGSTFSFVLITSAITKQKIDKGGSSTVGSLAETIHRQFEYVLKIITSQGYYIPYGTRISLKLLIGIWLLCNIVLINAYAGVLTSLLTVPKLEPIANTVEDIAKSDVLRMTIEDKLGLADIFMNATLGYEKIIGDKFRQDQTLFIADAFSAIENVVHRECAYLGDSSIIGFIIREDTKAFGYCRMTSSPEIIDYHSTVLQIGFPIGSPYASAFDEFILRMWSCGIVSLYKNRYFPSTDQCRTDVPPRTKTRSLKIEDLIPAFFILGVGLSFSITTFIIEILIGFLKKRSF